MRISNTAWTNSCRTAFSAGQNRGGFAAMLRKTGAEQAKKQVSRNELPTKLEPVRVNPLLLGQVKLSGLEKPVKVNLDKLSAEKRAELNEKYHIDEMKLNSKEYQELIKELQKEGILSDSDIVSLPPNTVSIGTNSEGAVTSILTWEGEYGEFRGSRNAVDHIRNSLRFASKGYKDLAEKILKSDEEKAMASIYESYQNILGAIEEIFDGQLNLDR